MASSSWRMLAAVLSWCSLAAAAGSAMQFTKLGSLQVSKVCLGTMTWGQQNTEAEAFEQLDMAFDKYGVNFLDTAEMYPVPTKAETQGRTDRIIGSWLKQRGLARDAVVIATKVAGPGITWLPGRGGENSRVRPQDIFASVDASLERLGVEYIDLLQIHWPDRYVPIFGAQGYNRSLERESVPLEEQLVALNTLIEQGKVREIGLSNETPFGVMRFAEIARSLKLRPMVSLQNSYSLINRAEYDSGLNEVCSPRNENIGLLPYSPLAGGILSGKYASGEDTSNCRLTLFPGYMARYKQSLAVAAVAKYCTLAQSAGLTPTELALGWCYKQTHVASTIIGATSVTQLQENLDAFDTSKWARINDAAIDDIHKQCKDPSKL